MEGNARAAPLHSTEQNIYCSHLFKSTLALPPQLALFELWGLLQSDWLEIVTLYEYPTRASQDSLHCDHQNVLYLSYYTIDLLYSGRKLGNIENNIHVHHRY